MEDQALIFVRISQATVLLPLMAGIVRIRLLTREQRFVFLLAIFSTLTEGSALYIVYFFDDPNNWFVYHLYALALFVVLNRLYKTVLRPTLKASVFDVLLILFIIFALINSLFVQSLRSINSNTIIAGNVLYILFSLVFFYQLLKQASLERVSTSPMFWINSGVLLYNSGALTLFILVNYVLTVSMEVVTVSWILNASFNVVMNTMFSIGLWMKSSK